MESRLKPYWSTIAVVFLFQFTWIGIIIEAIANRQIPSKEKLLAIAILFIGTILIVNGSLGEGLWKLDSILGFFGVLLPVLLFSIGTPKIDQV